MVKPLKDFSRPFDQVAPQVLIGRRLGSSEGPFKCNNIEPVQFKGVRHFIIVSLPSTLLQLGHIFSFRLGPLALLSFCKDLSILEARAARNSYGVSTAVLQSGNNNYSTTLFMVICWLQIYIYIIYVIQVYTKHQIGNTKYLWTRSATPTPRASILDATSPLSTAAATPVIII